MDKWLGQVAVVTGASSGIGEAVAEALVEHGMTVVALARREERLKSLEARLEGKKGKLHPLRTDITNTEDITAALKWIESNVGAIHVLVNNAGIVIKKSFSELEDEDLLKVFNVNLVSLSIMTARVLKVMESNNIELGHIFNMSSVNGHVSHPLPEFVSYFASKRAVNAVSEGIRSEIAASGLRVKVTNLSPGVVSTEMLSNVGLDKLPPGFLPMLQPKDVADALIYTLSTPPNVVVSELIIQPMGETIYRPPPPMPQ
ncbi:farnesol dehydrogenase [Nilaparvata lugens]|uniref:farnesol dehydrogenase n=1 Tax=Nilaparvata lugens TaxID=108931 RepID=UPI00193D9AB5|nr:farnesol dehydrogenase [Nilaparvata lugens]XP_039279087.1 farnesol dehydrogenase [Nilaparvata lugens]XP_039279088.1 farnesol dehydrogenase [Nilaparvata lugens]XP_039279089.1 farnesol dehydrogenase [Nilaparvata lugens]XP_039279090.1 farnesol dehydrogenase [Nilaparvata lugens]